MDKNNLLPYANKPNCSKKVVQRGVVIHNLKIEQAMTSPKDKERPRVKNPDKETKD